MFKALRAFNVVGPYKMLSRGPGVGRVAPPIWCHHFPSTQYGTHTDQVPTGQQLYDCYKISWLCEPGLDHWEQFMAAAYPGGGGFGLRAVGPGH